MFTTQPQINTMTEELHVIADFDIPDNVSAAEFVDLVKSFAEETKRHKGCIQFDLLQNAEDSRYWMYERYIHFHNFTVQIHDNQKTLHKNLPLICRVLQPYTWDSGLPKLAAFSCAPLLLDQHISTAFSLSGSYV